MLSWYVLIGIQLAKEIKEASPGTLLKDFTSTMQKEEFKDKIHSLREKVEEFASQFPMPGYENY